MTFWQVFDYVYGTLICVFVVYFGIMSAFIPKPEYIYDEDEDHGKH